MNNIETLFGALEMARMIKTLSDYTPEEIEEFRELLVLLIVRTLEESILFYPDTVREFRAHHSYDNLVELVTEKGFGKSSVITFDYDIALDLSFELHHTRINYCLDEKRDGDINLLKLHGSVNWARREDDQIIPNPMGWLLKDASMIRSRKVGFNVVANGDLHKVSKYVGNARFDALPVIVPPTWNKIQYHGTLNHVWTEAGQEPVDSTKYLCFWLFTARE